MRTLGYSVAMALLGLALGGEAGAQDQLVVVNKPLAACQVPQGTEWSLSDVRNAVRSVLPAAPKEDEYIIVHVVNYTNAATIGSQQWYVYNERWSNPAEPAWLLDPSYGSHYRRQRIFGSRHVGVVYVYRDVEALPADRVKQLTPSGKSTADVIFQHQDTDEPFVKGPGGLFLLRSFSDLAGLKYKVAITKKIPAPLQNLQAAAELGFRGEGEAQIVKAAPQKVTLCAGDLFDVGPVPSDMIVSAVVGTEKEKELSKQTYDNEGKYRYDFSFALPLNSYKDLTYEKKDNVVTAKEIKKESLFATVNVSPFAFDTKRAQVQLLPRFLYGMPITGKPLQHHLLAAAIGLNRAQVFVGVLFNRTETPSGNELPKTATWERTLSFGLNLPVQSVVAVLKPKK